MPDPLATNGQFLVAAHSRSLNEALSEPCALATISYPSGVGNAGNGTNGAWTRDTNGTTTGLAWTGPAAITSNTVTRTQTGRVIDESVDGTDPFVGANYTYDTAGRLIGARLTGAVYHQYDYTPTGGCGANTLAGANSNRTALRVNTVAVASYCYDSADRLTSVASTVVPHSAYAGAGAPVYDSYGNTTAIAGQELEYDAANRHMATYAPTKAQPRTSVVYTRDVTDRIVQRQSTVVSTITHRASTTGTTGAVTATSVTVNKPAGTVVGDVMVAAVAADGGSGVTITAPAGWVSAQTVTNSTLIRTHVFYKIVTGTEPVSYAFTLSVAKKAAAGISTYAGVNTTTPIDTPTSSAGVTVTAHNAPGVTTTGLYSQVTSALTGIDALVTLALRPSVTTRTDRTAYTASGDTGDATMTAAATRCFCSV